MLLTSTGTQIRCRGWGEGAEMKNLFWGDDMDRTVMSPDLYTDAFSFQCDGLKRWVTVEVIKVE